MPRELIPLAAEIGGREIRAEISTVGAGIQGLWVEGVALVHGSTTAEPAMTSGVVLVPWPNRVRAARWTLHGETQYLEATESVGNAIHGLLANTEYTVVRADRDRLVLTARVEHPPGYPFALDVDVEYTLVASGIESRIGVRNRAGHAAPVAVGVHPYVRLGTTPSEGLTLAIDATRVLPLGDDDLPLSSIGVQGIPFDLRDGVPVGSASRHACFTGLRAQDGRVRLRLIGAGASVEVWCDTRFRWAQVYITDQFPGLGPGELAIALEPMTAPPDALNTGTDLHWLAPGRRWSREWGISLSPA